MVNQIQYADDIIKELDEERIEAIKKYLELQTPFKVLSENNLCKYIEINYEKEELDVDSLTKPQQNKLDSIKDEEKREAYLEKLPKTMQSYSIWAVLPNEIQNTIGKMVISIDQLNTREIQIINERIEVRIELYKDFIK